MKTVDMKSLKKILLEIKDRPALYLGCNTISCLKAFLSGWYLRDPNDDEIIDSDIMEKFQIWVTETFDVKTSHSWDKILLFYSADEYEALNKFFEYFEEFCQKNNL